MSANMTAKRTFAIWLVLVAGFYAIYAAPNAIVGALLGGGGLLASLFVIPLLKLVNRRLQSPRKRLQQLAVIAILVVWLLPGAAATWIACGWGRAAALASLAPWLVLAPYIWRQMRARRCVIRLQRALSISGDATRWIAEVRRHRTPAYLGSLEILLRYHRPDLVDELASGPWSRHAELDHLAALIDLGRLADARAKLDGLAGRTANAPTTDRLVLLGARLDLAEGHPPAVLAETTHLPDLRLEVLADLHAARGDRDGARRAIHELRARGSVESVRSLAGSARPSASVAAEVIAGVETPYR
jgi:hypothetical protein